MHRFARKINDDKMTIGVIIPPIVRLKFQPRLLLFKNEKSEIVYSNQVPIIKVAEKFSTFHSA